MSEFRPEVARLSDIRDLLVELIGVTLAAHGGKPPRIPPAARPRTQVDVARERASQRWHDSLVAEVQEAQQRWAEAKERSL